MGWLFDDLQDEDGTPYWGQPREPRDEPSTPPDATPEITVNQTVPVTRPPQLQPQQPRPWMPRPGQTTPPQHGQGGRLGQTAPAGGYNQQMGFAPGSAPGSSASAAFGSTFAKRTNRDLQRIGLNNAATGNAYKR